MKFMSFGIWQEEGLETLEGTFYSFCHPISEIVMLHQKIFIFHFTNYCQQILKWGLHIYASPLGFMFM